MAVLDQLLENTISAVDTALADAIPDLQIREIGVLSRIHGDVAYVKGLSSIAYESLLEFPGGVLGVAMDLGQEEVGVVLLGDGAGLAAGDEVRATGRQVGTFVGSHLLGRVVDAGGRVLDGGSQLEHTEYWPIERDAPAIMDRAPVSVPLQTGIKVIDALIPIGRGQRELIVGDRQTGKTSIAINAILNQRDTGVICIYCAIGQRSTAVARVIEILRRHHALEYTIVVVASGEDEPGLQFITPYAATSMAEYFMQQGRDVLLVYDDLTRHARAYREISLLLKRPPGREAYPGDIFYIHSRLLERATHLIAEQGGGSLTALPIVETQEQDISAYIPTNLISITDGQIYLSSTLFRKGLLPAIDVGKSVSRVGGKTQLPAYRKVAGDLRLSYSQFEELETFARFGTRLDAETRALIERGRRVRAVLAQDEYQTLSVAEQIAVLYAVTKGLLDQVSLEHINTVEQYIYENLLKGLPAVCRKMTQTGPLPEEDWQSLKQLITDLLLKINFNKLARV